MREISVPAKWVLAGEHSVLRGAPAIALPHPDKGIVLTIRSPNSKYTSSISVSPAEITDLVMDLIRRAGDYFKKPIAGSLSGQLDFRSNIPEAAGLGSSAALCVALSRWILESLDGSEQELAALATHLENKFHGQSSGMDIAVAVQNRPLLFRKNRNPELLSLTSLPRFSFHDTGLRSQTRDSIQKVQSLFETQPVLAQELDQRMAQATVEGQEGLLSYSNLNKNDGLRLVSQAMHRAQSCFLEWGLVPPSAGEQAQRLLAEGALAVKLTGAGGGGFLVALWPDR